MVVSLRRLRFLVASGNGGGIFHHRPRHSVRGLENAEMVGLLGDQFLLVRPSHSARQSKSTALDGFPSSSIDLDPLHGGVLRTVRPCVGQG